MSVHTGRMSRTEAHQTLQHIQHTAREFGAQGDLIARSARAEQEAADRTGFPSASAIRALLRELNELVAARLLNSASLPPQTAQAITIYLFGAQSSLFSATEEAAALAAQELSVSPDELRLVDHTPVSTATWTGARYTFRVRAAWDPAPAPAEAPSTSAAAL